MAKIKALKAYTEGKELSRVEITSKNGKITHLKENAFDDYSYDVESLCPSFFDTHINGGENLHFTQTISKESVKDIVNSSAKHATAYTLPCLITSSLENILKGIEVIKGLGPEVVPGMHLEGPFLNVDKRGAHLEKYIRKPSDTEINKILKVGEEVIKVWTIAPENFTYRQIAMIHEAGITVSAGHSNATYGESKKAFSYGIDLVTHLYNAMSAFNHRDPGLIGATLEDDEVWAPIIPDGKHCDWAAARIAYLCKPDKLFLISDALFLGRKKQHFQWEELNATYRNGSYYNQEGKLAGSAISMSEGITNAIDYIGIPLATALSMATDRPAEAVGLSYKLGKLAVGYPSKLVGFDAHKLNFQLIDLDNN